MTSPLDSSNSRLSLKAPESLVGRLVRAALLWAIPLLVLAAFALTWLYRSSTYQIFEGPLNETVTALINATETIFPETGPAIIAINQEPVDPRFQRALSGSYWEVFSVEPDQRLTSQISSRSLYGSSLSIDPRHVRALLASPGLDVKANAIGPDGEALRVVARSVLLPDLPEPFIMMAAMDQGPAVSAVRRFALVSGLFLTLLVLGLIGAVLVQVRTGLRPIFDLRDRVVDIREGRAAAVTGEYPTEIDPLAYELNSLIAHNKDIVDRARTHVSNLAHALKTPLAVLRNEASRTHGPLSDIAARQTDIMNRQVSHHLARARAAARAKTTAERTSIVATVSDLARTLEKIYRDKRLDIVTDIPSNLFFRGEKQDLEEIIGNLLDNGCKWAGQIVHISARRVGDSEIELTISDDGPGLDESEYGVALQRGMRLDEATPGTGFGLSIVDDLARAYNGTLQLQRSELGGLGAIVTLPAAPLA